MNPPHTTAGMHQLQGFPLSKPIMMAMAPPDRMPLPPRNWKVQGYICPSRQKVPAQYLARATSSGEMCPAIKVANSTASTAFTTSDRITTRVSGPPNTR